MWVIRAGIHNIPVRKANREDPDRTASSEAVWSWPALFVLTFEQATSVQNFRTFTVWLVMKNSQRLQDVRCLQAHFVDLFFVMRMNDIFHCIMWCFVIFRFTWHQIMERIVRTLEGPIPNIYLLVFGHLSSLLNLSKSKILFYWT